MDDAQRHQVAIGIGFAVGLGSFFAPQIWPKMPIELAWTGMAFAVVSLLWGPWPLGATLLKRGAPKELTDDPTEVLPLQEAARLAYEAVEGTVLGMQAHRLPNAPDGPLCFMAEKLYMADMPIYGKRFPSSKVMRLDTDILFSQKFKQDAAVVEDENNRVTYTDLTAKRGEMTTAIEALQGAYKDR